MSAQVPAANPLLDVAAAAPEGTSLPARNSLDAVAKASLVLLGLWTLPGLLSTALVHFQSPPGQALWKSFASQVPPWWFWAPATPLIFRLGRAFPISKGAWTRSVPVHVLVALVLSAGALAVAVASCEASAVGACREMPFWVSFRKLAVYYAELNLGIYGVVVAAGSALESSRRAREEEVRSARLQGMLATAQLQALKMQLHPHFLFNTLHAVGVMVRKGDQEGALRMLSGVSDLLRIALESGGKQRVPLLQELEFLERYLDVERTRFRDRLTVKIDVEPATRDALLPNLILQPVVENAIRHGIETRAEPGNVSLVARREAGTLRVTVRDDGPGLDGASGVKGTGIGLSNVRARLEQLYPGKHVFTVENAPGGGVLVTLEIPFELEGANG